MFVTKIVSKVTNMGFSVTKIVTTVWWFVGISGMLWCVYFGNSERIIRDEGRFKGVLR